MKMPLMVVGFRQKGLRRAGRVAAMERMLACGRPGCARGRRVMRRGRAG